MDKNGCCDRPDYGFFYSHVSRSPNGESLPLKTRLIVVTIYGLDYKINDLMNVYRAKQSGNDDKSLKLLITMDGNNNVILRDINQTGRL
jgi:hypothetical protein